MPSSRGDSEGARNRTALGLALLVCAAFGIAAESPRAREYEVKAAFLYHFASFVEWPPEAPAHAGEQFVIGILGDDPFGSDLDAAVDGKTVNDRLLLIRRAKRLEDLRGCAIAFISRSESDRLTEILDALREWNVLSVGEGEDFASLGGIITFVTRDSKVHFVINQQAALQARLKISSKLLSVADSVIGQAGARP